MPLAPPSKNQQTPELEIIITAAARWLFQMSMSVTIFSSELINLPEVPSIAEEPAELYFLAGYCLDKKSINTIYAFV